VRGEVSLVEPRSESYTNLGDCQVPRFRFAPQNPEGQGTRKKKKKPIVGNGDEAPALYDLVTAWIEGPAPGQAAPRDTQSFNLCPSASIHSLGLTKSKI